MACLVLWIASLCAKAGRRNRLRFVVCFIIAACLTCGFRSVAQAGDDPYDDLYDSIMKRQWPSGVAVEEDSPTPLLWADSRYLLREPAVSRFLSALDAFEMLTDSDLQNYGPLKRALLQRQLWSVFDWTASQSWSKADPEVSGIQLRLAVLLRKLSLSAEEIAALPESIGQSVPADSEVTNGEGPKLPGDLSDASGPWVCVRRARVGLIAPAHSRSAEWRSAFLVYVRLPGGRRATLDYLERLGSFRETIVSGERGLELNPDTPQFPVGTQFALVERPLLISDRGKPVMSPLCFRLQLRSYQSVTETFIPEFSTRPTQLLAEFVMRPRRLMSGKSALEPLRVNQTHYATFFTNDPFETQGISSGNDMHRALTNCMVCHAAPGILSVNSRAFTQLSQELPVAFREAEPETIGEHTGLAKQQHFTWGLLQGLWRQGQMAKP